MSFTYESTLYGANLPDYGRRLYKLICDEVTLRSETKTNCLVALACSGSSGCAIASAILCAVESDGPDFVSVFVHKEEEGHHSSSIINELALKQAQFIVFVDDFISQGYTFERVESAARRNGASISFIALCHRRPSYYIDHRIKPMGMTILYAEQ